MEQVRANVKRGDEVVHENIEVWIETSQASWRGSFLTAKPNLINDDRLTLEIADGRIGGFVVKRMDPEELPQFRATILGSGPFRTA